MDAKTEIRRWSCDDGNAEVECTGASAQEAAEEYCSEGEWGNDTSTCWVSVRCTPLDDDGEPDDDESRDITVQLDPEEPDCEDGEAHDWCSPCELLGGLEENPGVQGHGGGCRGTEVCSRCGLYRTSDSWAQNPETGEQGLDSIEYRGADSASEGWIEGLDEAEMESLLAEANDGWDLAQDLAQEEGDPYCWSVLESGRWGWGVLSNGPDGPEFDRYKTEESARDAMGRAAEDYL